MSVIEQAYFKAKNEGRSGLLSCPNPEHEDRNPSFNFFRKTNGSIGVKCHSRCSEDECLDGLDWAVWYDYTEYDGSLLYQVRRINWPDGTKDIIQRRPDGKGGWIYNMEGVWRLLYNNQFFSQEETVFIVEGEKCADCLFLRGIPAATNSGGAGKWQDDYSDELSGKHLILLPDNDEPGKRHMEYVASSVHLVAASVKYVELPDLKDKEDVYDWFEKGHTKQELLALVDQTQEYQPPKRSTFNTQIRTSGRYHLTELGNAERAANEHSHEIRHVTEMKRWIEFDGSRWEPVSDVTVYQRVAKTIRRIYKEAADVKNLTKRKAMAGWALNSEKKTVMTNTIALMEKQPTIAVAAEDLDSDPWLLACVNGTIDLRTGQFRDADRVDMITKLCPIVYDATATCPTWLKFLERVIPDANIRDFLQRAIGYTLTGIVNEHMLFFLYGKGHNGKSKFTEVLEALLIEHWVRIRSDVLMASKFGPQHGATPELAQMKGKRLVTVSEIQQGHHLNEALIKDLTGGDAITARELYSQPITFQPTHKVWMYGNHKPEIKNTDVGIWRRPKLIPFTVEIPAAERDVRLGEKLKVELPGILNWAIEGCLLWQSEGMKVPKEVENATEEYRQEQDVISQFLDECCEGEPGETNPDTAIRSQHMKTYTRYRDWCEESGLTPLTKMAFSQAMKEKGYTSANKGGVYHWLGLIVGEMKVNVRN